MSPEYMSISAALRNKAATVRNVNATTEKEDQVLRDAADLLRVFAKIMEGMPPPKAFGAPGDWGYETEIGKAVLALRQGTCAGAKDSAPDICDISEEEGRPA